MSRWCRGDFVIEGKKREREREREREKEVGQRMGT